jgi:hypothetical protein
MSDKELEDEISRILEEEEWVVLEKSLGEGSEKDKRDANKYVEAVLRGTLR